MNNGRQKTWKSTYNSKMEDQKHENLHTIQKLKTKNMNMNIQFEKLKTKIHEHEHATLENRHSIRK